MPAQGRGVRGHSRASPASQLPNRYGSYFSCTNSTCAPTFSHGLTVLICSGLCRRARCFGEDAAPDLDRGKPKRECFFSGTLLSNIQQAGSMPPLLEARVWILIAPKGMGLSPSSHVRIFPRARFMYLSARPRSGAHTHGRRPAVHPDGGRHDQWQTAPYTAITQIHLFPVPH